MHADVKIFLAEMGEIGGLDLGTSGGSQGRRTPLTRPEVDEDCTESKCECL